MEIIAFLERDDVDPIYFDSSFVAIPDEHGEKPYRLLLQALEHTKKMGVAKVTMHQREYTIFIRARNNGLTMHTMYYQNEISTVEGYGKAYDVKLKAEEIKLADQLVENLSGAFKPETFKDEFQGTPPNESIKQNSRGKRSHFRPSQGKHPSSISWKLSKKSLSVEQTKPKKVAPTAARRQQKRAS